MNPFKLTGKAVIAAKGRLIGPLCWNARLPEIWLQAAFGLALDVRQTQSGEGAYRSARMSRRRTTTVSLNARE